MTRVSRIQTSEFVEQKFAEYYRRNLGSIPPPSTIDKREFAFLLFKGKTMVRHKGFKNENSFRDFLLGAKPSDVYYSSAYFERPEADMDEKGWLGADLIFDIDADHIPTQCDKQHDMWNCRSCGASGRGAKPEKCAKCDGSKFSELSWLCETCLESAKKETIKLIESLERDFGFSEKELTLAFSGHRGYHVHIEAPEVRPLDSMARKEIVDYMAGVGVELGIYDVENGLMPILNGFGWNGRIARGTYEFLLSANNAQLERIGLKKNIIAKILEQRDQLLESWKDKGPWKILKGIGPENWRRILQQGIAQQSVKIDTVVTTDVHRLIRLSNTLHGETGLKKVEFAAGEIERFDPLKNAIAFTEGSILVKVAETPEFRLGDVTYGPFKNQKIELPTAAAMFLLCKGVAKTEEESAPV